MGADDFIRKPFSERLLVERVKAVLWPPGLHILNSRQNLSASWSAASSRPLVASCPKTWIAGSRTSERQPVRRYESKCEQTTLLDWFERLNCPWKGRTPPTIAVH